MNSNISNCTNNTSPTIIDDEDEIKRYKIDKHGHSTIIAVFEDDYVRFAKELKNGKLAEEKIVSQKEFEKMIEQEGWIKEQKDG